MGVKPDPKAQYERVIAKAIRTASGCLLFNGATKGNGYGHMTSEGRNIPAHRFVYEYLHGKLPDDVFVCHRCDVGLCIEEAHLFPDTQKVNLADCKAKGRNYRTLNEEQVVEIKSRIASGETLRSIAKDYDVTADNISKIKQGKTWR